MQNKWIRLILWCAVLGTALMILRFSAQNAEQSGKTSGVVTKRVIMMIYPEYKQLPVEQRQSVYDAYQHFVRKSAHFLEYALLGMLLRLLMESYMLRRGNRWSWAIGTAYAGLDELQQWLGGTRAGMLADVFLDSGGVLFGVLAALFLLKVISTCKKCRRMQRRKIGENG